ncbi:MAG: acyl-CoA dehydrogenase, partial [Gammaproteobacteria bacterium]|nr:acyl-CoA dehydrogenase [Gammaproteobacteria bacterium]
GHGYVAEWGLEQNVRDARIAQIYEGANGVQALDLMGRKTVRANGELLALLSEEMDAFVASQAGVPAMQSYLVSLATCRKVLSDATGFVIESAASNPEEIGAASYAYMELMGLTLYCFMWQRILAAALADKDGDNAEYLDGLVKVGEFFLARQVPRVHSLLAEIEAGSESLMAMAANQF